MIPTQLPTFPPQTHDDCIDSKFIFEMIPADDAISSCTVTVVPNDLLIETVSFYGNEVTCWIAGGTDGVAYVITIDVTTTGGRTYCRCAVIPVEAPDTNVSTIPPAPTAERITTGASPVNASIAVSVSFVTSGGTAGAEHIVLPNFPSDPSAGSLLAPFQIGTRHTIMLVTQTNPSDSVHVFVGSDNSGTFALDSAGNPVAIVDTTGIILDYEGAFVSYEWAGAFWSLRNEAGQTDTVYEPPVTVVLPDVEHPFLLMGA